jgi:hypothetical protein
MKLSEVSDKRTARTFVHLPKILYRNDPHWICPPDKEVEAVFDPERNNFFSHGVCTRWVLYNGDGTPIGRIAAFVNYHKAYKGTQPTGGIGFFECINDKAAAHYLFDEARNWLLQKGMLAMDGPINFGENDKYWGLLIEGFKPPSLGMNYNPAYYKELFESYGFQKMYDQFTNLLDATKPMPDRFNRIADRVMSNPQYFFKHFKKNQFEKFAEDLQEVYNDAWAEVENFTPIEMKTIRESFRQMKPIMDEKIIWYAYHQNEPIAFVICMPDINEVLKHLNGRMDLWGKLKFFWYYRTTMIDRLRIIIMGCKKKFQNHGIESALIRCLYKEVVPRKTIRDVELAWVGDNNPKMMALHEASGAKKDKVHRTYRYVFPEK